MVRRSHVDFAPWASGQTHCTGLTLAERLCRTADRIDSARVFGSRHVLGEAHLRRNSESYARYYNGVRTHRSLNKDTPILGGLSDPVS